jgi:hypothetical protein
MWEPIANDLYGPLGHAGRLDTPGAPEGGADPRRETRVASREQEFPYHLRLVSRVSRLATVFIEVDIGRSVANSLP